MLKEALIRALSQDKQVLDMRQLTIQVSWDDIRYDLIGLILKVSGYTLQVSLEVECNVVKLPLNAPNIDRQWLTFEERTAIAHQTYREISALARQLWAAEYGDDEAIALPFYEMNSGIPGTRWWDDLCDVSQEDVVKMLKGEVIYKLNSVSKRRS